MTAVVQAQFEEKRCYNSVPPPSSHAHCLAGDQATMVVGNLKSRELQDNLVDWPRGKLQEQWGISDLFGKSRRPAVMLVHVKSRNNL